jgi:uncharacterized membrane protein (DUF373 family)
MAGLSRLRRWFSDYGVLQLVDRGERLLARLLSLVLLVVLGLATLQLLVTLAQELPHQEAWMGDSLIELLGNMLNLLIGLEVLQNIAAYLRKEGLQIDLVLLTAMTAVGRKVIVLPPGSEGKPLLLAGLGVALLSLAVAYWLVRQAGKPTRPDLETFRHLDPDRELETR